MNECLLWDRHFDGHVPMHETYGNYIQVGERREGKKKGREGGRGHKRSAKDLDKKD